MEDDTPTFAQKFGLRDAAAAIIVDADGRLLMQKRDDFPEITYPGYWALFGGGIDPGENPEDALRRELAEELEFEAANIEYFTTMTFDFSFSGLREYSRHVYVVPIRESEKGSLVLHEGAAMSFLATSQILYDLPTCPNDAFAVWLYANRSRFHDLHGPGGAPR